MNARWAAALLLGAALICSGCQANASVQQARTPNEAPVTEARRALTLDLGDGVTLKLVEIPAGTFMMGSKYSPEEVEQRYGGPAAWYEKEHPRHEVTISKPFYMGVTPVTVDQFAAFVADSGYKTEAERDGWSLGIEIKDGKLQIRRTEGCTWFNPGIDQEGDHPVIYVSWEDASAFCKWLSKKSGRTVVLPTEAQWEYACRAGTTTAFPWGDDLDDGKGWANTGDRSLNKKLFNAPAGWTFFSWDDGFVFTSPVGHFKPNAFGLHDMIGNVSEWCQDWFGDYGEGPVTDPTGPDWSRRRVLRGGSWSSHAPGVCRSAYRGRGYPSYRREFRGFRVVAVSESVD